ncbi:DUF72 domain-containing protein [bacterium]|nr:DUF72 domain-containing protein [bacterium]
MPAALHIGTCSWKYPSWNGLVYSSEKPENFLREYSKKYGSVEIDQWFWSLFGVDKIVLPNATVVEEYANSINPEFRFVIKAPNSISLTHLYKQYSAGKLVENPHFLSPELYNNFLFSITGIAKNVGAINLQFEYLNKLKMSSAALFLERIVNFISKIDTSIPLCIEIRNPNILSTAYFEMLQDSGIGHTFCQGYYMPDIRDVFEKYESLLSNTCIIRLLGPDRQGIEKISGKVWNKIVAPKDAEIAGIAKLIQRMVDQSGMDVYLNVNNHYEGSAPVTIDRLQSYL